jgi:hypothetical protein
LVRAIPPWTTGDGVSRGTPREFNEYRVWIVGEPASEYAKVRPEEGALGVGRRVAVQREGQRDWLPGTLVAAPPGVVTSGFVLWVQLDATPPPRES